MYGGKDNDVKTKIVETRAMLKKIGVGFNGIDDDDFMQKIIEGRTTQPYEGDIYPNPNTFSISPTEISIDETELAAILQQKDIEIKARREQRNKEIINRTMGIVEKKKNQVGGTGPASLEAPLKPVLAMSNYSNFRDNAVKETHKYLQYIQTRINNYLNINDANNTIHAMVVITAPLQHAGNRTDASRLQLLESLPTSLSFQLGELLGLSIQENKVKKFNFYFVHLCDHLIECKDSAVFKDMSSFEPLVKLPKHDNMLSSFHIFDVNSGNVTTDILDFMNDNKINFLFLTGGETHWLNRQLTKCNFKYALARYKNKIVVSGNSAGIINIGNSSYVTASKNYKEPTEKCFDDVRDLCDEKGERINSSCGTKKPPQGRNPVDFYASSEWCPPNKCNDLNIKYNTLCFHNLTYFPHFADYDTDFISNVINKCLNLTGKNFQCMRLSDNMMAFTEGHLTSYIFSNPKVYDCIGAEIFRDIRENKLNKLNEPNYDESIRIESLYEVWQDQYPELLDFEDDIKAYLHSCSTIPENRQTNVQEFVRSVPVLTNYLGGSRVSTNYLSIAFLGVVTIIAAFFKR